MGLAQRVAIGVSSSAHCVLRTLGLSGKYPYRVRVMGTPLWWAGEDGRPEQIGGFYTTRTVLAASRDAAIIIVIDMVSREIERIAKNPAGSPVNIEVDHCERLDGCAWRQGGGFSFWLE